MNALREIVKMNDQEKARSHALFNVGQICGIASQLNLDALEIFLMNPPRDFRYTKDAKAVLALAKTLRGN